MVCFNCSLVYTMHFVLIRFLLGDMADKTKWAKMLKILQKYEVNATTTYVHTLFLLATY